MTSRITNKDLTPIPQLGAVEVKTAQEWADLLEKELPDDELLQVHKQGLHATIMRAQIDGRDSKGAPTYTYVPEDDMITRAKYLELAYKVKGKLIEGANSPIINIQINSNEPI